MYPDLSYTESTTTETLVMGVASAKPQFEGAAEMGAENDGCKCGPNCNCNPCTCKWTWKWEFEAEMCLSSYPLVAGRIIITT